jgi:hypothetical protein
MLKPIDFHCDAEKQNVALAVSAKAAQTKMIRKMLSGSTKPRTMFQIIAWRKE